ncbi:hypothetical protein IFE09_00075 [Streptomyces microflavus]|nr:hypothetical protein [Streptomyces microflavus]QQZ52445.1 hypothetical protein IFE09_00075 [Streptomyces microflavus]
MATAARLGPYTPDHPDPVLMYAVEVASELRLMPHLEEFDGEVAQLLDKVEADNELAVIILDPWTIELSGRQAALGEYDKRLTMNRDGRAQNASDTETAANTDALRQQLLNVLGRHAQLREPCSRCRSRRWRPSRTRYVRSSSNSPAK